MVKEYTVDSPIVAKENVKPLHISEQAEVAYWFECDANDKLVYCEVSLDDMGDCEKISLHTEDALKSQLSVQKNLFTYTLSRVNLMNGERILVYSVPNLAQTPD